MVVLGIGLRVGLGLMSSLGSHDGLSGMIEGDVEQVATGFEFTEGPVWHPDGYLVFSDIPAGIIYKWQPDGSVSVFRNPSGGSNGLTFDEQGRLIACEWKTRRVTRGEPDGSLTVLAEQYEGKRFNSPNDVVVKSNGSIYFTDPYYGFPGTQERELDFRGVYRIDPDGTLTLLVDDFQTPNGLAFSPDEKILYVDDTGRRHIRAFDVQEDGSLANGRLFLDMACDAPGPSDGMKVDTDGNLYCTGGGGIWVIRPDGTHLGTIELPELPKNCAFGDADQRTLYMTADTSVYKVRIKTRGIEVLPKS